MKMKTILMTAMIAAASVAAADAPAGIGEKPPDRERVLIVPAHPDDLSSALGFCLVTRDIFEIHVVDFTHGERGCGPAKFENGWTKAKRTAEEQRVCDAIGAALHWLDEVDGEAYACRETCDRLARLIMELKPAAIIAHWPVDIHGDHTMAGAAALKAVFTASDKDYKPEVYFFDQGYQAKCFAADRFVDITDVIDRKQEIIQYWECQVAKSSDGKPRRGGIGDAVKGMSTAMLRHTYAEGFRSMFPLVNGKKTIFDKIPPSPRDTVRWQGAKVPLTSLKCD